MQSDPQRSGHGIPLLAGALSCAKIHRGCTDYFMRRWTADNPAEFSSLCLFRLWGAHAPRVLIAAPRRNALETEKFAMARAPSPAREARALSGQETSRSFHFAD